MVHVDVFSEGHFAAFGLTKDEAERLEMARQLVELSGGSLNVIPGQGQQRTSAIRIALPAAEQVPVLVVDDNVDTLRLLERYLSNSRYRFTGTSDPEQAVRLAEELAPQIIVLDVMLPQVDGWELLGRLHEHPKTGNIPVVVCTILPQEQLAANLGAADLIRKPVSRQAFLSALDRQLAVP
jgi:CheY-like chemotaxis protein